MQQRFHISYHPDFETALVAKKKIADEQPNNFFQIRRRKDNFELVGRTSVQNAKVYLESQQGAYSKRKKPKRLWRKRDNYQTNNTN